MKNSEILFTEDKKHPFLWMVVLCLGVAIALTRLNIYLGTQVNYLDYLPFFNALTIAILACASIAIILGLAGLWKAHFKSLPLALVSLASFAYLTLLFLID
jgi:hypothetical protein